MTPYPTNESCTLLNTFFNILVLYPAAASMPEVPYHPSRRIRRVDDRTDSNVSFTRFTTSSYLLSGTRRRERALQLCPVFPTTFLATMRMDFSLASSRTMPLIFHPTQFVHVLSSLHQCVKSSSNCSGSSERYHRYLAVCR